MFQNLEFFISEGPKHPDLVQFYWDNVVSRGLGAMNEILRRGVERGEFQKSAVTEQAHLFIMPVVFSVVFNLLFENQSVDTDRLIETQIDILITHMQGTNS